MDKISRDGQLLAFIEITAVGLSSIINDIKSIDTFGYTSTLIHLALTLILLIVMGVLTFSEVLDNYLHGIIFFIFSVIIIAPMLVFMNAMYYLHFLLIVLYLMTAMYKNFKLCKTYMIITVCTYPFIVCLRWFLVGPYKVFTLNLLTNFFIVMVCELIIGTFVGNDERNRKIIRDNSQSSKDMLKVVGMKRFEAEQEAKSRAVFLANMSHEIRTPINAIIGINEMVRTEKDSEQIISYCDDIKAAGNQLISLINDILDSSMIESGGFMIRNSEYDVRMMLDEIVSINGSKVINDKNKKGKVDIIFSISPDIPCRLCGDSLRIKQIMNNLISNAIKYTLEGSIEINIKSVRNPIQGNIDLIISVRDTGIGIKEADLERMLQRYVRLEEGMDCNIEGTGLGLSITGYLVEAMDGHLDIESEYEKGSVFTAAVRQEVVDYTSIGEFRHNEIKKFKKMFDEDECKSRYEKRILVVDDNSLNLKVAMGLMNRLGLNVDICDSGYEALGLAKKNKYDLILLDHMMPGMDGIETLHLLRRIDSLSCNTPIVALTANAAIGSREYYLDQGFSDYLTKPIIYEQLEKLIYKYIGNESKEDKCQSLKSVKSESFKFDIYGENITKEALTEKLSEGGYDVNAGLSFGNNDIGIYLSMLNMFADNSESNMTKLEKSIENKDISNYIVGIHTLKGNAKCIGATDLYNMAYKLEQAAKDDDFKRITDDWSHLSEKWKRAVEIIHSLGKKY